MPELFNHPLAIIDVETTGMSHAQGGVIDIGILRVENGQVVKTMQQLVNPGSSLPAFITQLTGITNDHLLDAPRFTDIATDVYEILEDCIFIAHNVRFDYAFVKEELRRSGYYYQPKQLCTVKLSRALYPQFKSHKLDALIDRFKLHISNRHRAFADAEVTWQALQIMASRDDERFDACVAQQLRRPSLPVAISPQTIQELPQSAGVYIFEAANGATLYVGKSVNIHDRVLSHFNDDHRSAKEMRISQEIHTIKTIPTNGELGALLKEAELIKELMPIHNRMLRRQTDMIMAIQGQDEHSYPTIHIERHAEIASGNTTGIKLDSVMAIFKSERQAKESLIALAKEYNLCHKLLGIQKTKGACFMHQLKACKGACVGKESPLEYQMRFDQAFHSTKIAQWPFSEPMLITEQHPEVQRATGYIVNQWAVIGRIESRDQESEFIQQAPKFELDQYKILKRYIDNPKNAKNIKPFHHRLLKSMINENTPEEISSEVL